MSQNPLTTYLNDHLSGATAALDLLGQLLKDPPDSEAERELTQVRAEIEEDKSVLVGILKRAGGKESKVRTAAARLAGKVGQAKLALDQPGGRAFRDLEALEALALGIQGKAALWRLLAAIAGQVKELEPLEYGTLERRAHDQFQQVDRIRLRIGRDALSS
jgi:hypothetical protein